MSVERNPSGSEPSGGPSTTARRLITGLSLWWTAVPVVFAAQVFIGISGVRGSLGEGLVLVMLWACVGGVVLAPVIGFATARATGHTEARKRFATMGALSLGFCLLVVLFLRFAAECAPGDPSCS
ncbi:hypothetical protein [Streptomyces virginiae]|uniref:Uncharacterized protein n=1 Tax=Streptomyces virginiae TaxID=1961 RepID=A0ABZ1TDY7_STRVG|nr:hypothetical protein [Streptomyces virginiae]